MGVLTKPSAYALKLPPIPPLESGDLTRAEFERR